MGASALLRGGVACFFAVWVGCTQDFGVFEPDGAASDGGDATTPTDGASGDASVNEAGGDGGALSFTCGGDAVGDCSQCSGMPQPCVYCEQGNAASLAGRCVAMNGSCFIGAPSGYTLCSCTAASSCPESFQVCRNKTCRTCSDSNNNGGLTCQSGGTCNDQDGGCGP